MAAGRGAPKEASRSCTRRSLAVLKEGAAGLALDAMGSLPSNIASSAAIGWLNTGSRISRFRDARDIRTFGLGLAPSSTRTCRGLDARDIDKDRGNPEAWVAPCLPMSFPPSHAVRHTCDAAPARKRLSF